MKKSRIPRSSPSLSPPSAKPAIALLGVAAILLMAGGCQSLRDVADGMRRPEISIVATELEALSFSGLTLRFDAEIQNPNPIGLSLAGFDYELEIEGNPFVSGEVSEKVVIAARDRTIVPLPVELAFEEIVDAIGELEDKEEAAYSLSAGFSFDLPVLGRIRIPISTGGSFPILRIPRLRVSALRLEEISLAGAKLELDLELSNRNNFKIFVQALDYRFRVNGQDWLVGMRQERVRLSEYGSTGLTIPFDLDFSAVGRSVYQMILGAEPLQYGLTANIEIGTSLKALKSANLPFELAGQLRIQR